MPGQESSRIHTIVKIGCQRLSAVRQRARGRGLDEGTLHEIPRRIQEEIFAADYGKKVNSLSRFWGALLDY